MKNTKALFTNLSAECYIPYIFNIKENQKRKPLTVKIHAKTERHLFNVVSLFIITIILEVYFNLVFLSLMQ